MKEQKCGKSEGRWRNGTEETGAEGGTKDGVGEWKNEGRGGGAKVHGQSDRATGITEGDRDTVREQYWGGLCGRRGAQGGGSAPGPSRWRPEG